MRSRSTGRPWVRLRRAVLDRDGWRCQRCGRAGRLEAHHANGDPSDDRADNLLTLCRGCHIRAHRRPLTPAEAAWRALVRETWGLDKPVDT